MSDKSQSRSKPSALEVSGGTPRSELKRRQRAYRDLLRVLPESQREAARKLEKVKPEPSWHIQVYRGFDMPDGSKTGLVADRELRALTNFGAALYGRQMEWDAGRTWFEEPSWVSMESTHDAIDTFTVDLAYCVATDLDQMCHIQRRPFVPPISGILRTPPGFQMPPAKLDGIRWCFCLEPPKTWAGVYFPWYKSAFRPQRGDIFAVPGQAWPGFAPVAEGYGYFLLSHEPPEHAKRSLIIAKK